MMTELGSNARGNRIHPTAIIKENVTLGERVEVMEFVVLGAYPVSYERVSRFPIRSIRRTSLHGVKVGDDVTLHTGAVIHSGTERVTEIRDRVVVAQNVCIGHDAKIGEGVHINNSALLLGFVEVGRGSIIGAGAQIKPRKKIGQNTIVGIGATVTKDIPNNCVAYNTTKDGEAVYCRYVRKSRNEMKELIRRLLV